MESESELRMIRWMIILAIISAIGWMILSEYVSISDDKNKVILAPTSIVSGFGEITLFNTVPDELSSKNIYHDKDLGFKISIPTDSWKLQSMSNNLDDENMQALKSKGFLDGIYLNKNNNTRFMVAVFDVSQKSSFELSSYIDTQIDTMKGTSNVEIPIKQVSTSNDWAIFGAHIHSQINDDYGEQLLYLENDKLYMLQYTGLSPTELDTKIKSEYRSILDSFEIVG
jgi:hypothetical protein